MCWLCDNPCSTWTDYLEHMRDLIATLGWAVQGVEGDGIHPPWAYTVGMSARSLPELVVTGMPLTDATGLLNDVAHHMTHAAAPEPGEQIPLRGGPLIEIVCVPEPAAHLNVAVDLYGTQLRALQLVHADERGHWPWEAAYRGVRGGQPVLGVRAEVITRIAADEPPGAAA